MKTKNTKKTLSIELGSLCIVLVILGALLIILHALDSSPDTSLPGVFLLGLGVIGAVVAAIEANTPP